jgi:HD-like signal output (HDOD) protein
MTVTTSPDAIIARTGDLPTLPAIYARIAELTADPETGARDLEKVIENDQALASKLLKLVNSAFFGFPVEIRTIGRAVMIVGFRALSQLAMSASVLDLFPEGDEEVLDYQAFWAHSIGSAILARRISKTREIGAPEELFLAGLLHDLGVLVHARHLTEEFPGILRDARAHDRFLFESERDVLGFDHAATGQVLALDWRLPNAIAESVAGHHRPSRAGTVEPATAVIHVACVLASGAGLGHEGVDLVPPLDRAAWDIVGLSPAQVPDLLEGVEDETGLFLEMMDT